MRAASRYQVSDAFRCITLPAFEILASSPPLTINTWRDRAMQREEPLMASRFVTAGHAFKGLATLLSIAGCCLAQTDPGPRGGSAGAGGGSSGPTAHTPPFLPPPLIRSH